MKAQTLKSVKSQKGFTLVELAVVMIIIGLLIGGILKGQELISNAQVNATVAQVKGVQAGVNTFSDMYSALPGDMTNPVVRIPNCVGSCAVVGNGNGRIGGVGAAMLAAQVGENLAAWGMLAQADLIAGIDVNGAAVPGGSIPSAELNGTMAISFVTGGAAGAGGVPGTAAGPLRGGHYITLQGTAAGTAASLTPTQAARMDQKLDDGQAATGSVIGDATNAACLAGGVYNEAVDGVDCALHIRLN